MRELMITMWIILTVSWGFTQALTCDDPFETHLSSDNQNDVYRTSEINTRVSSYRINARSQAVYPEDTQSMFTETDFVKFTKKSFYPDDLTDFEELRLNATASGSNASFDTRLNEGSIESGPPHSAQQMKMIDHWGNTLLLDETGCVAGSTQRPQDNSVRLRRALSRYRTIAKKGGWPIVPAGPLMKKGDRGRRVAILRSRLIRTGHFDPFSERSGQVFDDALVQAVRAFQETHGLQVDGAVGSNTLAALNVPLEERLRQIRLNMVRWHEFSQDLGQRYILINIVNFELKVIENNQTIMRMRAVVGRPDRPTPVFGGEMTYLVLNPHWHIPAQIAREDILPKVQKNSEYLLQHNIRVFEICEDQMLEIDREMIDWSMSRVDTFAYKLRQDPGPANALGRIKFIFPNTHSVYIHDTPAPELFLKTKRNFSSGCIRIEKPVDLAEYLLRGERNWTREKLLAVLDSGVTQTVRITRPIPVYIVYCTAWVDDNGNVQFRDDIYGRDMVLKTAMTDPSLKT